MKIAFFSLSLFFKQLSAFGTIPIEYQDTVKVRLLMNKDPLIGASFYIKGKNHLGNTDLSGEVTLYIPKDEKIVKISMMGPYVELKIIRPVDFIIFDIYTKRATYYLKNQKEKIKRQLVKRY